MPVSNPKMKSFLTLQRGVAFCRGFQSSFDCKLVPNYPLFFKDDSLLFIDLWQVLLHMLKHIQKALIRHLWLKIMLIYTWNVEDDYALSSEQIVDASIVCETIEQENHYSSRKRFPHLHFKFFFVWEVKYTASSTYGAH